MHMRIVYIWYLSTCIDICTAQPFLLALVSEMIFMFVRDPPRSSPDVFDYVLMYFFQNIVKLLYFFFLNSDGRDDLYLNLILEYVPETVYRVARQFSKQRQQVPLIYVRLYTYQVCACKSSIYELIDFPAVPCPCLYSSCWSVPS